MKNKIVKLITLLVVIGLAVSTLVSFAGCSSPAPANSPSGTTYSLAVSLLDKTEQFTLDSQGKLKTPVQLTSADGKVGMFIYAGTKVLDKSNQPLQAVSASIDRQPPLMPENTDVIGAVYKLSPDGAQFNPSLRLTISYNPTDLPDGVNEGNIYVATYQDGAWSEIPYKNIDTSKHSVTTAFDHASEFAVLIPLGEQPSTATPTPAATSTEPANPNAVNVVVAGYINHGPLQPTVQAIKDVMAKYGNKVNVTWIDLGTSTGAAYFKANNLSAHMNVIINGKYTYVVNGKSVTFQWFEGQQWTKADLDAVISSLVEK